VVRSRLIVALLFAGVTTGTVQAGLPKTLEEFQTQIAEKAKDPKAAVKLWFDAVYVYLTVDKELGQKLILEMDRYKDWDSRSFLAFRSQVATQPHIMFSYAKGATPENQYKCDPNNYQLTFQGEPNLKPIADKEEGEYARLLLVSNGADMPRSITLVRNNKGEYKVYEFSSLCVGVRPPKTGQVWGPDIPESQDPVWTFKQWLQGLLMYLAGDKDAGPAQMNSLMKEPDPGLQTFHGTLDATKAYIWRSYVKGATPENGYSVPDVKSFEVDTYFQPGQAPTPTSTRIGLFVRSSGADTARPVLLQKDDRGQWRLTDYSSLCVGVRPPKDPKAGDF